MIKSMTGFGRASGSQGGLEVTIELRSVNHRYFEFSSRMPRAFQFAEEKLKALCQQSISRGKVEASVFIEDTNENATEIEINRQYADAYLKALKSLTKEYKL